MKYESAERYAILYDLPKGEYRGAEVGGIRTRTIRAGNTIEVECYPLTRIGRCAKVEAVRRRKQRACQEALNRRNAEKLIRRLIEENFTPEDFVVTLTWDYGPAMNFEMSWKDREKAWDDYRLPWEEEDARREWNNYLRRIKTRIRQAGEAPEELKHLYVLESTHEPRLEDPNALPAHYHFHAVIHAPGLSRGALEDLWPNGRAEVKALSFRGEGPASLAAYMTKQRRVETVDADGKRARRWGRSKNLRMPAETVSDRKVSRRRAAIVAAEVQGEGRAIFEKIYPGYRCVEEPTVRYSDYIAGAYIYARLRKIEPEPPWRRTKKR